MKLLLICLALFSAPILADEIHPLGLVQAVEADQLSVVRRTIERGNATVDQMVSSSPYGENGISILALAARAGAVRVAEYLINNGANLDIKNSAGETAIMLAAFFDDAYWKGEGRFENNDAIARMLVDHGANLDNGNFWGALAYAGYKGRSFIGNYMIQHGAPVDGYVKNGISQYLTPLMMAARNGHKNFTLILLRAGADPTIKTPDGVTAHYLAKYYKQTHLIGYIECALELKADEKFSDKCEGQ